MRKQPNVLVSLTGLTLLAGVYTVTSSLLHTRDTVVFGYEDPCEATCDDNDTSLPVCDNNGVLYSKRFRFVILKVLLSSLFESESSIIIPQ